MSGLSWGRSYCQFLWRHRLLIIAFTVALNVPAAFWASGVTLSSRITDYYPAQHPHVRLYQEFTEMLRMTNLVVVTVRVENGTIYTPETLGKIHRITIDLLETRGVNPFEVMSLTHPRLKDITVGTAGISILPVVDHPEQPQSPEALARIKNAVYTNLGIRGVYVSPDDKTALIRAGFWDSMLEPRAILARLQNLAEREQDANTEVAFTGNLVLAAWLIEAAPRVLLLLVLSGGVALIFAGQMLGRLLSGTVVVLLTCGLGALWGLGLLTARGLTLEPLAVLAFFPLCIRGIVLTTCWHIHFSREYRAVLTPFAEATGCEQALEKTALALWRLLTVALCMDGVAMLTLVLSDVPALQALGYLGAGWTLGLLVVLWVLLPLWSSLTRLRTERSSGSSSWGERLTARVAAALDRVSRLRILARLALVVTGIVGVAAAAQLQAGRQMFGTTLFYPSHPYNRAYGHVNAGFIGVNQLIVIARAPGESAFRDPQALLALEAFQYHMAEDEHFGGALAITGLAKAITRMFHEEVPKWEIIPDDIDSAGQVIFRIISTAATPSEVERLLSSDFHTTAVTLFYRNYSPQLIERALARARGFTFTQDGKAGTGVEFRVGGGILGVLAAVHEAVEQNYWRMLGMGMVLACVGAVLGLGTLRAVFSVAAVFLLSQGILLTLLWLGNIDLNVYTLPVIVCSLGTVLIPAFLSWDQETDTAYCLQALAATGLIVASAASAWLFSPLRLQAEMGVFLIVVAVVNALVPLLVRRQVQQLQYS